MDNDWERQLLNASRRRNEREEVEFLRLVDMAKGNCNPETIRILMKTFSAKPDFGTQERVSSVLATADDEDVARGILGELPRLVSEAPEWAKTLVYTELVHRPELLASVVGGMNAEVNACLRKIVADLTIEGDLPEGARLLSNKSPTSLT